MVDSLRDMVEEKHYGMFREWDRRMGVDDEVWEILSAHPMFQALARRGYVKNLAHLVMGAHIYKQGLAQGIDPADARRPRKRTYKRRAARRNYNRLLRFMEPFWAEKMHEAVHGEWVSRELQKPLLDKAPFLVLWSPTRVVWYFGVEPATDEGYCFEYAVQRWEPVDWKERQRAWNAENPKHPYKTPDAFRMAWGRSIKTLEVSWDPPGVLVFPPQSAGNPGNRLLVHNVAFPQELVPLLGATSGGSNDGVNSGGNRTTSEPRTGEGGNASSDTTTRRSSNSKED